MLVLVHADHGRAVLWVSARTPGEGRGSPFDRATLRIAYEGAGAGRTCRSRALLEPSPIVSTPTRRSLRS
jgi:hypothetical protein